MDASDGDKAKVFDTGVHSTITIPDLFLLS